MIENLIKYKKGEACIVTLTKKRIKLNLNMVCMFTGKLGAGKSWSGISYAQQLDPEYDVDKQVVFDFKQTMNLINDDEFKKKKMKVIVWDEPQITISNRAWQSQMNKLVNYLMSTFRHQNITLILCAPYKDFLDSQTMKLLQWEFQCSKINKRKGTCEVYPKYQQYNPNKKRTYPHPLYVIKNRKRKLMRIWKIRKPDKKSIKIYEENKLNFTKNLNKSIQDKLDKIEDKPKSILDIGTTKQREAKRLCVKYKGNIKKVAKELGNSLPTVYTKLGGKENLANLMEICSNSLEN